MGVVVVAHVILVSAQALLVLTLGLGTWAGLTIRVLTGIELNNCKCIPMLISG